MLLTSSAIPPPLFFPSLCTFLLPLRLKRKLRGPGVCTIFLQPCVGEIHNTAFLIFSCVLIGVQACQNYLPVVSYVLLFYHYVASSLHTNYLLSSSCQDIIPVTSWVLKAQSTFPRRELLLSWILLIKVVSCINYHYYLIIMSLWSGLVVWSSLRSNMTLPLWIMFPFTIKYAIKQGKF